MNLSELQRLFVEIDLHPSRKLGQNFLIDGNVANWITDQLAVDSDDLVVEVGPGAGSLTRNLLQRTENLLLIEFDRRLASFLTQRLEERSSVTVVHQDACHFDTRQLYPRQPVRFIGNLPYSAGGEIIRNFLGPHSPVQEAVIMVQREVAERLVAVPRTKNFSVFTLRVQSRWDVRLAKHIGPDCFYPRPQVDSTVLHLRRKEPEALPTFDPVLFDSLVRRGFAQRRKQLRKGLLVPDEQWEAARKTLNLSSTVRAEELSLEQWVALTRFLDPHPLKDHAQRAEELFDVVDEEDEVIGQNTRGEVHRTGLRHRAVHLFLQNKAGEVFLQKRSRLKDVHPGAWDSSAAGHLDSGESYESAAQRELHEELDQTGAISELARLSPSEANGQEFIRLYRAIASGKVRWPSSEIEYGLFFPPDLIDRWIEARPHDFAGGFLECWRAGRDQL
ncbi:MAG: 16S rRNA (adenine(1518)-N(6)/adenine(1519)-N(6))-dimethyltransferase RsmA [Verrucomicrobiota bacterium]